MQNDGGGQGAICEQRPECSAGAVVMLGQEGGVGSAGARTAPERAGPLVQVAESDSPEVNDAASQSCCGAEGGEKRPDASCLEPRQQRPPATAKGAQRERGPAAQQCLPGPCTRAPRVAGSRCGRQGTACRAPAPGLNA